MRNLSVNERKVLLLVEADFLQFLLKSAETFSDKVLVVLHFDPLVSRVSVDEADGPGHGDPPLVLPPIVRTTVDLDMGLLSRQSEGLGLRMEGKKC